MSKIKSVEDLVVATVMQAVQEDRLSFEEAIVEALEGMKQNDVSCPSEYNCPYCQRGLTRKCYTASAREDINDAYDQAIATIRSIYQDNK